MEGITEKTILLVDDEPGYHAIIEALLERQDIGFVGVRDAPAAFQAVRSSRYDLILMDIEMAGINGFRGASHIRSSADWTLTVPIVAFTAYRPPDALRHFLSRGFDAWLPKPFAATHLLAILSSLLGADYIRPAREEYGVELRKLLGEDCARGVAERLCSSLSAAIAAIDAGADPKTYGHNLGGLAGTIGLPELGVAWSTLADGNLRAWPTVRELSLEAIADARAARETADP